MCPGNGWMWRGGYGGMGWGGWLAMTVGWILLFALVITAVVVAVRYLGASGRRWPEAGRPQAPQDLLAERFARGEIDDEEYRRRMTLLREHSGSGR